jgi:hypothetical protein
MKIADIEMAIKTGSLESIDLAAAKNKLDNEIFQCNEVIQDHETQEHDRLAYKATKTRLQILKNKL